MKIALDAMGGDNAPIEIIAGALRAVDEGFVDPQEVILVGDRERIELGLSQQGRAAEIEIHHAPEVIGMDEHPGMALRRKRNSSIVLGAKLLRGGLASAMVSAGNTGAMVAAGTLLVRLLPGVRRPGIAATFATAAEPVTLIDVGANIHCHPEDLYTYGQMAVAYRVGIHGLESPRVGLLSIGEEDAKGGPLIQKTRELFHQSDLNFVGNIEGQDLFSGRCDVIVCEGFVGNVVLKVSEGLGSFMARLMESGVRQHANDAEGGVWKKVGKELFAKTDYAEYGGAPLLGTDGLIVICHGRSGRRAIANALRVSKQFLLAGVNEKIVEGLAKGPALGGVIRGRERSEANDRNGDTGGTA
ncbi:MAG: phosphate acyltransferase PlsX [Planctomycetota bacterium]